MIFLAYFGYILSFFAFPSPLVPAPDCEWKSNQTETRPFFFYTPAPARALFKTEEYIRATAGWEKHKKGLWLRLIIQIRDEEALGLFGGIDEGASIYLETLKGKKIVLKSAKKAVVSSNPKSELVTFESWWIITPKIRQQIATSDLGSLELEWEKGNQTYELFDTEFLKRLCWCL